MAMTARPVPQDPYNPLHASDSHDSGRYPSPLIPIRLPIFAIVIWLNDILVRALSITGSVGQKPRRHHKVPSNSSEKAEEGAGIEMSRITSNGARQEHYRNARKPVERTKVHSRVLPIDRRKHD